MNINFKDFTTEQEQEFRKNTENKYPATEIAFINRYIQGEKDLKKDINESNLNLCLDVLKYKNDR